MSIKPAIAAALRRGQRRRSATGAPLEAHIRRAIMDYLSAHGIPVYLLEAGSEDAAHRGTHVDPGVPDLCALLNDGRTLWIECKSARGRLRLAQRYFQAECVGRGVPHVVARSVEDVAPWIEQGRMRRGENL